MWLLLALLAYILFAAVTIADKYLLARPIPDARVYTFYVGVFGLFAFVLAPFGFQIPAGLFIFLSIFAGILFVGGLFLFFTALRMGEVSRVGISLGGLVPFFTLLFVYIGVNELPNPTQIIAFMLLATGSLIIIFERAQKVVRHLVTFGLVFGASILFGLYFTVAKFLFFEQPFISAFIWIKIGGALFASLFLFSPAVRKMIFKHKKLPLKKTRNIGGILIIKSAVGGVAALLLHAAISFARFGEVAVVNALQGVQFALVFFIALFLTKNFPKIIKEEIHRDAVITKVVGTGFVIAGIMVLAFM